MRGSFNVTFQQLALQQLIRQCERIWMGCVDAVQNRIHADTFSFRPLNTSLTDSNGSLIPVEWSDRATADVAVAHCSSQRFPGISEPCWWPLRKCVLMHESLVMWLSVTLPISLQDSPLSFCRCVLVVLHPLSHSLSLLHVCFSHTTEETLGQTLTSGALRPLFWHGFPEGKVSAVCSAPFGRHKWWQGRQPIRLGSLNGEHAHYAVSLVPQGEVASLAWMCLFSQALVRCHGVNVRKQRVMGSKFKMEGGRSEMEIQRADLSSARQPAWLSVTCSHSVWCTIAPPACHSGMGCAASTEVQCGSGSSWKKNRGGAACTAISVEELQKSWLLLT